MVSQFGAECLAEELASRDQRRPAGSGSALEALHDDTLYISLYSYLLSGMKLRYTLY